MTVGFVNRAGTGQRIAWLGGSVHRILLDGDATDGRLMAARSTMRGGSASPVHVHQVEDETVFVLSGSLVAWVGDQRFELGPGDTAFLPRLVPHTYAITSPEAELLSVCNPAGLESFFREAGWDLAQPMPDGWTVDMQALARASAATGQRVLGPPLAPDDTMPAELLGRPGSR